MGEFLPQLLDEGFQPRVMLEYSGTLLYGLRQMGASDVLDTLAQVTGDVRYRHSMEWPTPQMAQAPALPYLVWPLSEHRAPLWRAPISGVLRIPAG
jgi:hypothetical protein